MLSQLVEIAKAGWPKNDVDICTICDIISHMMKTHVEPVSQGGKREQAEAALAQVLADASRRGFYGTAGLTLAVQDGRIQHIRVVVERMVK
jgi:hypothetical protein